MPRKHAGKSDAFPALKEDISMLARHLGAMGASKGGIARAQNLTKTQRSNIASNAANARWQNQKEIKKYENPRKTYG